VRDSLNRQSVITIRKGKTNKHTQSLKVEVFFSDKVPTGKRLEDLEITLANAYVLIKKGKA
jgi:hypothetical protein